MNLFNLFKLETIVPPASKRYTPGPIRLAGASTTLHTSHKPTGMMAIPQPAIQTIPAPRLAVMVSILIFNFYYIRSGSKAGHIDAKYTSINASGCAAFDNAIDNANSDHHWSSSNE